jgi:hypothetical protein
MDIDGPFKVDPGIPSERGFWEFGLTYDSPKLGATQVLGRYAVSRLTGDAWETNLCKRYDFPSLKRIQSAIMARTKKPLPTKATPAEVSAAPRAKRRAAARENSRARLRIEPRKARSEARC